jgi:uncharacterized protein
MTRSDRELLADIETWSRKSCRGHDAAHDAAHLQRVANNARLILDREGEKAGTRDEFVVYSACWLHDLVQLPKGTGPAGESARRSAKLARDYLSEHGVDDERAAHVAAAVRTHSYSGGEKPSTIEAAIVQDADRLDALGAVGIARLFVVSATLDSALYHPDDPLSEHRPLEDNRYALDHIAAKLVNLPELMNTASARQIADERLAYIIGFRDQFIAEIGG